MLFAWRNVETCVLCRSKPADSREHVIPESLGGDLEAHLLCRDCNSTCGAALVSDVKKDPSIRLAVEHLKDRIGPVYEGIARQQAFLAIDDQGQTHRARLAGGLVQATARPGPQDSTYYPISEADKHIHERLRTRKISEDTAQSISAWIRDTPDSQWVVQYMNDRILKSPIRRVTPDLSGPLISDRFLLLLALEWLALHVRSEDLEQPFEPIRRAIKGEPGPCCWEVTRGGTKAIAPYHSIHIERGDSPVSVHVRIFGSLAFRVKFNHLVYHASAARPVYLQDVEHGQILFAKGVDEAKIGNWITILNG